jgi:RNA polymerase sigma-70 factor (ECF subfamily)
LNTQRQLERLLAELPPLCRAVFLLQKQEGLTYEEIAEKLGISVHAVQRYLFRALAALRAGKW